MLMAVFRGFVEVQHSFLVGRVARVREVVVVLLIGLAILYTGDLAIGFGLGINFHYWLRWLLRPHSA